MLGNFYLCICMELFHFLNVYKIFNIYLNKIQIYLIKLKKYWNQDKTIEDKKTGLFDLCLN